MKKEKLIEYCLKCKYNNMFEGINVMNNSQIAPLFFCGINYFKNIICMYVCIYKILKTSRA